jgi:hypothetical protein
LNPDGNFISGSMRRLCTQIIVSIESDYEEKNVETDELINKSIRIMRENSILVCIDNFEDIEDPQEMGDFEISKVNKEYTYFQKFFSKWSGEYLNIRKDEKTGLHGKHPSRIIITTRGKGEKTENQSYPVPPLSSTENYNLFIKKLHSRYTDRLIDIEIIEFVQS